MKTLLVTGGCGFIGSHFCRFFLNKNTDWQIINLDKLSYSGNLENLKDLEGSERYEFVRGDVCDKKLVRELLGKVDGLINFAAETHVDRSIENSDDFLKANILGVATLLERAKEIGLKRFIQMSTDEVYGSVYEGAASEDYPFLPNSPYSASKASADLLIRAFRVTHNYPAIIVRSSNNYGPFQFPEKVIPLFITNLFGKQNVPLYGKGDNKRDWIYVEDTCRALDLVFWKGAEGEIYNVGAGAEISNLELTKMILKLMGFGEDMIKRVQDRPGHDFRYALNVEKIKDIGFEPSWTFEKGLRKTVE